ncbi:MAG TPA: dienelactone hydrolase family protein [Streptosporangiaceae bacterium]
MYDAMMAETTKIIGHNGDPIEAYLARPLGPGPYGSVVVIHHMPGFDEGSKEIVRRFATHGYLAICPNLHYREAPGASPDDASAANRAAGGVPDDRLVGDVDAAAQCLKRLPSSNGKAGTIGYCSGGRQSFLAACSLDLEAAVDCYGAFVVRKPPQGAPVPAAVHPIVDLAPQLSCPLLGLFGAEDKYPAPDEVAELEEALTKAGKTFEFHTYENAGHAFFSVERPNYRPEAAKDGWRRVFAFFDQHLGG